MINASLAHIWSLGGQREVDFELFGIKAIDINRIAQIADMHDASVDRLSGWIVVHSFGSPRYNGAMTAPAADTRST
jgi:hypothetical protein